MERRLNCYNYIFSNCIMESNCPFGHVIVNNKDDYLRRYESNVDGVKDKTSPRGNFHLDLNRISDTWNEYENNKRRSAVSPRDNNVAFLSCIRCNVLKPETKSLSNYLKTHNENFICRDCDIKSDNIANEVEYSDTKHNGRMSIRNL